MLHLQQNFYNIFITFSKRHRFGKKLKFSSLSSFPVSFSSFLSPTLSLQGSSLPFPLSLPSAVLHPRFAKARRKNLLEKMCSNSLTMINNQTTPFQLKCFLKKIRIKISHILLSEISDKNFPLTIQTKPNCIFPNLNI